MQRITISLPKYLYEDLIQRVPERGVSGFVAQAVESRLMAADVDPIKEFIKLRERLPKIKRQGIIQAIKKGRL